MNVWHIKPVDCRNCGTPNLQIMGQVYLDPDFDKCFDEFVKADHHISNKCMSDAVSLLFLQTSTEFQNEFASRGLAHISTYASNTYDAAWTIALTLKTAMERINNISGNTGRDYKRDINNSNANSSLDSFTTLENFTYQNAAMNSLFLDILSETRFIGVSVSGIGVLVFDKVHKFRLRNILF